MSHGEVTDMDCSCPYAADDNNCKHMAAVLFQIEENTPAPSHVPSLENQPRDRSANGYAGETPDVESIESIVSRMDETQLRTALTDLVQSDEKLQNGFVLKYGNGHDHAQEQWTHYRKETVDKIFRQCADRHGYVDWKCAPVLVNRLRDDVFFDLKDMTSGTEAAAAFALCLYLYEKYADTAIDDSGGETQIITEDCLDIWDAILENAEDEQLPEDMYQALTTASEKIGQSEYMGEAIFDFLGAHFKDDKHVRKRLELIDNKIKETVFSDSWNGKYELSRLVIERITIMKELDFSADVVEDFMRQYWRLPAVRKIKMEELSKRGKKKELIDLLLDSREMDKDSLGLVREYSQKLIECYEQLGQEDALRKELFEGVANYWKGDVRSFEKLRTLYSPEEWIKVRETVFSAIETKHLLRPLLQSEGLVERLMGSLQTEATESRGIPDYLLKELSRFEKSLRPKYEKELLAIYELIVEKMAVPVSGRKGYQEIASVLKRMQQYDGGKECVRTLLQHWRFQYGNRPAMMDELHRIW
jgi:hypothetical protein